MSSWMEASEREYRAGPVSALFHQAVGVLSSFGQYESDANVQVGVESENKTINNITAMP